MRRALAVCLTAVLAGCAGTRPGWVRRELTIPMRDGVRLHAVALAPARDTAPLPILLIRTPFDAARELLAAEPPAGFRELAKDGYIFVFEDIRGRSGSGGTFVTMRPLADPGDPEGIDESTDAWDTIDWLVQHLPHNNGKVGTLGYSYRGWLAAMAEVHPHPALRAVSPQAPVVDAWLGDDFFHQGAFRQTQGAAYAAWIESGKGFTVPDSDQYDFYLRFPTLDSLACATGVAETPSWAGFRAHPARDAYWKARALQEVLTRPTVPTLVVGGAWDAEDLFGPQALYATLAAHDTAGLAHFVLGPWWHGGWLRSPGDSIGPLALGDSTAAWFREHIQRPWFAYWLHGAGDGKFPAAWAFETGGNAWHTFARWPAPDATPKALYLGPGGALSFDPPAGGSPFDAYTSDPAHPVPYVPRPDDESGWATWMLDDQRFATARPDVRSWVSAPLAGDLVVAGNVTARLFASTTGTDADWVVKLIDVFPDSVAGARGLDGYQLMVSGDILRGRYWKGFDRATAVPANVVTPFTVDLHQQFYRFKAGHRIMVQVQSSWFPLYDRNPQTFVPNIFEARASDYRPAEQRVWHSAQYPSRVEVEVVGGDQE
ncbi:MAG TPA: CocE/NonD family hydrolase [Gemmatimonadales bacterium]|nr:CocE/NonD family hydrolase [Gemmatimonadales bacterium]